ncbi:MAG: tail fiber protein, partial [Acinetobacter sp.]|nr:tail fiber protein [Acinetobacter sp.]
MGAIIIKPPANLAKTATTMLRMSVEGYNYVTNTSWTAEIAGYHYPPSKAWLQTSATLNGKAPFNDIRFARNITDELHIILGDEKSRWAYPAILLRELITSYAYQDSWADGWEIVTSTDLSNYTFSSPVEVLGTGLVEAAKKLAKPFNINGVSCDGTSDVVVTTAPSFGINNTDSTKGLGLSLYSGATTGMPSFGMAFAGTRTFGSHGQVTGDWATYFTVGGGRDRGWIFQNAGANVASVNGWGDFTGRNFYGDLKGTADNATNADNAKQLVSNDKRAMNPKDVDKGLAQLYFTSDAGLKTDKQNTSYGDFLVLNSYRDATGGEMNGLFFSKNFEQGIFHYRGLFNGDKWSAPKQIAYTDSDSTGNSATATKLQTARTIQFSGAATGSVSYDGSANSSCILTLANSGVVAGTYGNNVTVPVITVDAKGLLKVVANQQIRGATTAQMGIVQLNDTLTSTSVDQAATANTVKKLNDTKLDAGN